MKEIITSRQNARIKSAARLRDRRGREEQGRIILDGVREIARAADAGVELLEVFVDAQALDHEGEQLLSRLDEAVEILPVTAAVFEKICFGKRAEGMVAVARPPGLELSEIELGAQALVAVLEGVEKPGNIGAVLRTADASGVTAVIAADPATDLFNPNAIRASAGTIFSLPVVAGSTNSVRAWLADNNFRILATRVDGSLVYSEASYAGRTAILLGSETQGLTDAWDGGEVTSIKLPMLGIADSLNVSVTAAVLFYEALRQRSTAASS